MENTENTGAQFRTKSARRCSPALFRLDDQAPPSVKPQGPWRMSVKIRSMAPRTFVSGIAKSVFNTDADPQNAEKKHGEAFVSMMRRMSPTGCSGTSRSTNASSSSAPPVQ